MATEEAKAQTIKEKADAEAARAESEEPESGEPAEGDPDAGDEAAEAEEQGQPAEPQSRRAGKSPQERFERAFTAFRTKCAEVFEVPVAEIVNAPHPGVVGIMLPGFSEPRTHENFIRCNTCNGRGFVLTGAVTGDPAKDQRDCPDTRCKGRGYWEKASAATAPPQTGPLAVGVAPTENGDYAEAPRWMGDPALGPQG